MGEQDYGENEEKRLNLKATGHRREKSMLPEINPAEKRIEIEKMGGSAKKDDRRGSISRVKKGGRRELFPDWTEEVAPINVKSFRNAKIGDPDDNKEKGQVTSDQYKQEPKKKNYKNLNHTFL